MGKDTGFMTVTRFNQQKEEVQSRIKHFNEHNIQLTDKELKDQASRCMDCGIPFCHIGKKLNRFVSGCPLHNLIPEWNNLVYQGNYEEAYQRLIHTNPFPEITSRVCPAPCEGSCTDGLHYEPVTIKQIEYKIMDYAFKHNLVQPTKIPTTSKKVAVVGSGPAGLSTAYYLNNEGIQVTILEQNDRAGGLLQYGIPNMKLEKSILNRRIDLLSKSGVTFKYNTKVTKHTLTSITKEYDAVVFAIGTEKARDISVKGRDLNNIYFALEYLEDTIRHYTYKEPLHIDAKDKNVIILGGGDTATDCLATALRQNAASIKQFEIMPDKPQVRTNNPWPEYPVVHKVDYGQEEAIQLNGVDPRHFNIMTTEFVGTDSVEQVKTVNVQFENGKLLPIPNTEQTWDADLVIIAAGFVGHDDSMTKELQINEYQATDENIFLCGDMRIGQSLVVTAFEEGKQVAKKVLEYLDE